MVEILKGNIEATPPSPSCIGSNCPYLVREKKDYYCSHPLERKKLITGKNCKSMYDSRTGDDAVKKPVSKT